MPNITVIAYHFSKQDEASILSHVSPLDRTDSFIVGVTDTGNIARLRELGILLDIPDITGEDAYERSQESAHGRLPPSNTPANDATPTR